MPTLTASDISNYRNQVFNFLQTVSFKYTPLSDQYNTVLSQMGYDVNPDDPTTWKYYLNLQGQYHASDTMMQIVSLDTRETINFTVENLSQHPRTQTDYVPGTIYFDALCAKYPTQVDLIKSIVYPISDVESAINADDFTILASGTGFLEDAEYGYILDELQEKLTYIGTRWYAPNLAYEPYYLLTFYGLVWQMLPQIIFSARFKAIRTTHVHSWLVWQYLASRGISDYSDVLDRQRTMWLYRNIDYLLANRGSKGNLSKMADNLLDVVGIGMFERRVSMQVDAGAAYNALTPMLSATQLPTKYEDTSVEVPIQTVEDIVYRQFATGDEIDTSAENINAITATLNASQLNNHPTKILEIHPLTRGKRYVDAFFNLVLDQLVGGITFGYYIPTIEIALSDTSESNILTGLEALTFFFYCMYRSWGMVPTVLPYQYTSRMMYRQVPNPIQQTFQYGADTYYTDQLVDIPGFLQNYTALFPTKTADPQTFSNFLGNLFLVAMNQLDWGRKGLSYLPQNKAMRYVVNAIIYQGPVPITLDATASTYAQWIAARPVLQSSVIDVIDESSDPKTLYDNLANQILTDLIPLSTVMEKYGNFTSTTTVYERLKALFIQMCSYNVTFLDAELDTGEILYTTGSGIALPASSATDELDVPPMETDLSSSVSIYPIEVRTSHLPFNEADHLVDYSMVDPQKDPTYTVQDLTGGDIFVEESKITLGTDHLVETLQVSFAASFYDNIDQLAAASSS